MGRMMRTRNLKNESLLEGERQQKQKRQKVDLLRPALTVGTTMIEPARKRQNERNMKPGKPTPSFWNVLYCKYCSDDTNKERSTSTTVLKLKVFVKDFIYSVVY